MILTILPRILTSVREKTIKVLPTPTDSKSSGVTILTILSEEMLLIMLQSPMLQQFTTPVSIKTNVPPPTSQCVDLTVCVRIQSDLIFANVWMGLTEMVELMEALVLILMNVRLALISARLPITQPDVRILKGHMSATA